jgi:hypothetical protein
MTKPPEVPHNFRREVIQPPQTPSDAEATPIPAADVEAQRRPAGDTSPRSPAHVDVTATFLTSLRVVGIIYVAIAAGLCLYVPWTIHSSVLGDRLPSGWAMPLGYAWLWSAPHPNASVDLRPVIATLIAVTAIFFLLVLGWPLRTRLPGLPRLVWTSMRASYDRFT